MLTIGRGVERSDRTDFYSSHMDSSKSDVQMGRTQTGAFKISHCDSTIHANPVQTCITHRHAFNSWRVELVATYILQSLKSFFSTHAE